MHYNMRLRICNREIFFGPGVKELLLLVNETGSLQMAAANMKMSYSKAWKMIKTMEQELGVSVLERQAGGSGGGFSKLTPVGKEFLDKYSSFEKEAHTIVDKLFIKYFEK